MRFATLSKKYRGGQPRWTPHTIQRYEAILRLLIQPERMFAAPLDQIKRKTLKSYQRRLAWRRSPATVETVHTVISAVFNEAIDEELLNANPAAGLLKSILPPKKQRDLKALDPFVLPEELHLLQDHAENIGSQAEVMVFKCMAYAGLRLGEALAMRREYLSPGQGTYLVCQSYKTRAFGKPKRGKSRLVDLPAFLVADLEVYIDSLRRSSFRKGKGGRVDLLYVDPTGKGGWPISQRKI
jgi:integrase